MDSRCLVIRRRREGGCLIERDGGNKRQRGTDFCMYGRQAGAGGF